MEERPPSPLDPDDRHATPFDPGAGETGERSSPSEPVPPAEAAPPPAFEPRASVEPPSPPYTTGAIPPPAKEPPIPWEHKGLDFFSAFYETLRLLFLKPRTGFRRVPVATSFARPLLFAILVGWLGFLATTLWDLAFSRYLQSMLPMASDQQWERNPAVEIGFALAAPLWLPVVLFLGALLQHLFLMMVGAGKRGFVATFRTLCYVQAASLLGLIPLVGGLLSLMWHLVLQVVGLSAVHRVSVGRVLLAVLLPVTVCCACLILLVAFGAAWLGWLKNG
jgi:hypothetical protein